jgi:hypothetical protein
MDKKVCPDGKVLNPKTNRCIKIKAVAAIVAVAAKAVLQKQEKVCPDGKVLNPKTNRCIKIKVEAVKPAKAAKKVAVKKPISLHKHSSPVVKSKSSSTRNERVDAFAKKVAAKKLQRFLMPFIKRVSYDINDRIKVYKIYVKYFSKYKQEQCLNVIKKGNNIEYSLANDNIKIVKKFGTESKNGSIYLSKGANGGELLRFASKIMPQTKDNKNEIKILKEVTKIVSSNTNPHFPLMYYNYSCSVLDNNNLPEVVTNKRYFINVNELANGDLQDFMLKEYDNYKKVNNALAQIYIAILSFHSIGYTHNDAHWGNFLYHKVKPGGYIKYVINGYDVYLENLGYLWVIWDYGQTTILDNLNIFITLDDYMKVIYAFNNKMHDGWVPNELRISKNTRDLVTKLSNIFKDIIKPKDKKRVKNVSFDVVLFESIINDTELFIMSGELPRDSKIVNAKPYIIKN